MRCATSVINPPMAAPAKGSEISSTRKIAMILGTKTSVISWIWVSACKQADDDADNKRGQHRGRADLQQDVDALACEVDGFGGRHFRIPCRQIGICMMLW